LRFNGGVKGATLLDVAIEFDLGHDDPALQASRWRSRALYVVDNQSGENQMIMFGKLLFSAECGLAVAECYGVISPVPDYMQVKGPYIRSSIEGGISTLSIYEFEDQRADEALVYLETRYAHFSEIEGANASVEEWLGVNVALQLLQETHSVTDALEAVSFRI
jgi:hypothetical protein